MSKIIIIIILSSFAFLSYADDFIYEDAIVRIVNYGLQGKVAKQTGVIISIERNGSARTGVITALHGVIAYPKIKAIYENEAHELYIDEVDIENDIAFLIPKNSWAPEITSFKSFTSLEARDKDAEVIVHGYPGNFKKLVERKVEIRTPETIKISDTGISQLSTWSARGSPVVDSEFIFLQGPVMPGDSGAPVIVNESIIGIVNGGLDYGRQHFSWAIPWSIIQLKKASIENSRLLALRREPLLVSILFNAHVEPKDRNGSPCLASEYKCWESWIYLAARAIKPSMPEVCSKLDSTLNVTVSEIQDIQAKLAYEVKLHRIEFFKVGIVKTIDRLDNIHPPIDSDEKLFLSFACSQLSNASAARVGSCYQGFALLRALGTPQFCEMNGHNDSASCQKFRQETTPKMIEESFKQCDSDTFTEDWSLEY